MSATLVVFRVWKGKDGDVIALFPEIPYDIYGSECLSYEHVGQHGAANYYHVLDRTRRAKPDEYVDLKEELEGRGYQLTVTSRTPYRVHSERIASARESRILAGSKSAPDTESRLAALDLANFPDEEKSARLARLEDARCILRAAGYGHMDTWFLLERAKARGYSWWIVPPKEGEEDG